MIKEVIMYEVNCDRCRDVVDDEFRLFCDAGSAEENAEENDWREIDGKMYCPECYHATEDEDVFVANKPIPKCVFEIPKIIKLLMGSAYISHLGHSEFFDRFVINGHTMDNESDLRPYVTDAISATCGFSPKIEYKEVLYRSGVCHNNRSFEIIIPK